MEDTVVVSQTDYYVVYSPDYCKYLQTVYKDSTNEANSIDSAMKFTDLDVAKAFAKQAHTVDGKEFIVRAMRTVLYEV